MVMAEKKTSSQIVEEHKPKNYKFKYVITDPTLEKELNEAGFDMSTLDTIRDADLVADALAAPFQSYPREVVAASKKPTQIENGVLLFKKMVTKTDKKIQNVKVGFFPHNNLRYACIKFVYERFEIIEIFILT
jgi:hypothetical protein